MPVGGKGVNKQWEGSKICIMTPIFSVRTLELLGLILSTGSFDVRLPALVFTTYSHFYQPYWRQV